MRLVDTNRKSALACRAISRQWKPPVRLVWIRYSGEPPYPAKTEGSAEHSRIRSGAGRIAARSASERTSPCTNRTPSAFSLGKFISEPRRRRLSNAITVVPGRSRRMAIARAEPTNPAPPVIRTVSCIDFGDLFVGGDHIRPVIIAARQMLLQPEVQHDEQVAAAHFLDLQLGNARRAVGRL